MAVSIGRDSSSLKKKTVKGTVTEDALYINTSIANSIEADMKKQLNIIKKQTKQAHKLCKKVKDKKEVKGEVANQFDKAIGGLKKRATETEKICNDLVTKYNSSVQDYVIKTLQETVSALEKRVSDLEGNNI